MKNRTVMTAIGVITLVLVVALMSGLVGFLVRDRHPELIGKGSEAAETSFIVTPEEKSGIMALSTMRAAAVTSSGEPSEGSYTLTATVSPGNATNKKVDWAVSWVNAGDSWAKGKQAEEYVTVSPSSDGSVQATVTCLAPFGAQIKVTCTSRSAPSVHAECLCDYVKRVTDVRMMIGTEADSYFFYLYPGSTIDPKEPSLWNVTPYSFENIEYSAYTVDNTLIFDTENSYAAFAEEFIAPFQSYYGGSTLSRMPEAKYSLKATGYSSDSYFNTIAGSGDDSVFGGLLHYGMDIFWSALSPILQCAASFMRSNSSLYCYEFHFAFKGSVRDQDFTFLVKQNPDKLV